MKKLLNTSLKTFSVYSFLVFITSIPAYYYLVDSIWLSELDENNELTANRIEQEFNRLQLDSIQLEESIALWNKIQPHTNLTKVDTATSMTEKFYTISRKNTYLLDEDVNRFRGLSKMIIINKMPLLLTVETIIEESDETVWAIAKLTFLFFILLVLGFLALNRALSYQLWKPFWHTLLQLQSFQLHKQAAIAFEKTNIVEFEELHASLYNLIEQNISIYQTQKEFTENASHELQTPLAMIKGKLDLLLQQESLTTGHYEIIEEINKVLTRISRINKNLLLLAKVENNQFDKTNFLDIGSVAVACIASLEEHFVNKKITLLQEINTTMTVVGNATLIGILLNNLLLNAIRYSSSGATIQVILNKQHLIVSNTGGSALDNQKIFNRFSSVSKTNSGSGLGLAIIKKICEVHNWSVNYKFESGVHVFCVVF